MHRRYVHEYQALARKARLAARKIRQPLKEGSERVEPLRVSKTDQRGS